MFRASKIEVADWCLSLRQHPHALMNTEGCRRKKESYWSFLACGQQMGIGRPSGVQLWRSPWQRPGYGRSLMGPWRTISEKVLDYHPVSEEGETVLNSTKDIVDRWREYFEKLLNPTDVSSGEE